MKPENESNGGKLPELAPAPCSPVLCYVDGSWAYFTTRAGSVCEPALSRDTEMKAYYNEYDKRAAAWLRQLIAEGKIADGDVDERSITDITPNDLKGYGQCHFFAGIGGWSLALRMAGVPDDWPVWTGSCPCQPFSAAGQGRGTDDERHLWPAFRWLIAQRGPAIVLGEQVASKAGRDWLAGIRFDLEGMGYACGAADLCAAGVKAPHLRQRLFWLADATGGRCQKPEPEAEPVQRMRIGSGFSTGRKKSHDRLHWNGGATLWPCKDGAMRRVPTEPALFPLADGIPGRVGLLRGAGNAIVPEIAAEFVRASILSLSNDEED